MRHGDGVTCERPLRQLYPRDTGVTEHTGTEPALAMSPAHAARAASPCEGPGTQMPVSEGQGHGQALSASTVLRLPQTASECPAFGVGGARGVHQCSQCSARNPKHSQHSQCVPSPQPSPTPGLTPLRVGRLARTRTQRHGCRASASSVLVFIRVTPGGGGQEQGTGMRGWRGHEEGHPGEEGGLLSPAVAKRDGKSEEPLSSWLCPVGLTSTRICSGSSRWECRRA